jgi:SAM-dependent methyltransferase
MPSPARPSIGEIGIFSKYINTRRNKPIRILILGSTPEFRDMCCSFQFETTCIDINQDIYEALTLLQTKPNPKERFIHANWLTFKSRQKYDFIIGDAVTAMFKLSLYTKFFNNMSSHLKQNGLLILRVPYQYHRFKIPIQNVMKDFRRNKTKTKHIYTATFNYLVMNYLNTRNSSISLKNLWLEIRKLYNEEVLNENEYQELVKYYKNLTLILYYPEEKYIGETSKHYYNILAKEFSLDYESSLANPIFVFEKI